MSTAGSQRWRSALWMLTCSSRDPFTGPSFCGPPAPCVPRDRGGKRGGGNAWTFSFTHSLYDLCHFRIIQLHLPAFFAGSELLVQAHVTAVWWKNPAVGDCSLELINIPKFCVSLFVNPSLQLPSIAAYLSTFLPSAFSSVNEKFCWGFGWGDWIYYETKFHFHLRKKIHFLYLQNVLACVFSSPSIWEGFCWIGLNVNINSRLYIVIESLL